MIDWNTGHRTGTNFVLERVTDPEIEPFTLTEMKRHLRCYVNVTDQDDDITQLIVAAREWAEDYTGRALIDQEWRLSFGDQVAIDPVTQQWCGSFVQTDNSVYLRRSPVLGISSFVSVDSEGAETAVDPDTYELREADSKWPRVFGLNGASWRYGQYRITFRAGYADRLGSPQEDTDVVPARYKQAIKLWAEAHFDRDKDLMPLLIQQAENMMRLERVNLQIA